MNLRKILLIMLLNKKNLKIKYNIANKNGLKFNYEININTNNGLNSKFSEEPPPVWTKLEFNQCPNCPLEPNEIEYCPVAIALTDLAQNLGKMVSYEEVDLVVMFEERWIGQRVSSQHAVSSLMGLLIASSGCPRTNFLRPMAMFHLPLANEHETLIRAVGMYLLGQYFSLKSGEEFDANLKGLVASYEELQLVNLSIATRLRESGEIKEMNALAILDMHSQVIPLQIEDNINELKYLFADPSGN